MKMKIIITIIISLIVGNYALSPPLADAGMAPDYALRNQDLEEIELEVDGDYINLDIGSNQQEKDLKQDGLSFNIVAEGKSGSVMVGDFPSILDPEDVESLSFPYTADVIIGDVRHYDYDNSESLVTDIPSSPSSELAVKEKLFSFTSILHKGFGGHATLPVETNPTI